MKSLERVLNHQVSSSVNALGCSDCHGGSARLDLPAEHGYQMLGPQNVVCRQCHGNENMPSFESLHNLHVSQRGYDCSWCHSFSRPERNLNAPSSILFQDGFDTGNTYAWEATSPW